MHHHNSVILLGVDPSFIYYLYRKEKRLVDVFMSHRWSGTKPCSLFLQLVAPRDVQIKIPHSHEALTHNFQDILSHSDIVELA